MYISNGKVIFGYFYLIWALLNMQRVKHSVSVPIAKQFFTINEKWVLVKFMKALGTFCV